MAIKSADQISIVDLTDGYSVILTSDGYTFPGTTNAAKAGSCTTQIIALCGADQVPAAVDLAAVSKPAGITVTKDTNTTSPTLTITASTSFTTAGVVTIPVLVDGEITIVKQFSVSIAFTGQTGATGEKGATGAAGKGVASVAIDYQGSTGNTTPPTGSWAATPPNVAAGSYLWTRIIFTYTDSTASDPVYSVAKQGATGSTGTAGGIWYTGTAITGTSTTATAFTGSGIATAVVGDMYLNTSTYDTYRCTVGGNATAAKWVYVNNIKGATGATGAAGADAITIAITSSNGMIFKNSSIETTLTAHVYKAGSEVTGTALTALGTIKWYKDGGSTAVATGATLNISAGDVSNKATYASINGNNTCTLTVQYGLSTGSAYSTATTLAFNTAAVIGAGSIDVNASYRIRFTLTDAFGAVERIVNVGTAAYTVFFRQGGNGVAFGKVSERPNAVEINADWGLYHGNDNLAGTVPIARGGTGATTAAAARAALGLGNTTGALPIANGGTGTTSAEGARNALGLGNTTGALPVANGGTGASDAATARNNLGITLANLGAAPSSHNHPASQINSGTLDRARLPFKFAYGSTTINGNSSVSVSYASAY